MKRKVTIKHGWLYNAAAGPSDALNQAQAIDLDSVRGYIRQKDGDGNFTITLDYGGAGFVISTGKDEEGIFSCLDSYFKLPTWRKMFERSFGKGHQFIVTGP